MQEFILNQITLPCIDLDRSVAFYRQMGFNQIVASDGYARFEAGESTFSLHTVEGEPNADGVVIYFEVASVAEAVAQLDAQGIEIERQPTDQSWLWTEAYVRDPCGNAICIYHAGSNRKHPPWRIN